MDGTLWLAIGVALFFFWTMFVHLLTRKWVLEEVEEYQYFEAIEEAERGVAHGTVINFPKHRAN